MAQIQLRDIFGEPIVRMSVVLDTPLNPRYDDKPSDFSGNLAFPVVVASPTGYNLYVNDQNVLPQYQATMVHVPDFSQDVLITVKPRIPEALKPSGWDIVTLSGKRYVHNQATNYLLFQRFLEGQDIVPLLYKGFDGYNVTFLMKIVSNQAGLKDLRPENYPNFYERVNQFLDLMTEYGKRVEATLLCDCNELGVDFNWQVKHTETLYDIIRTKTNVLVQLGNEVEKNGIEYQRFAQPGGVFWSRGSSLAGGPCPLPAGSYSTAHLSRNAGGDYLDAQPYYMVAGYTGYAGTNGAVITNETRGASNTENSGRRTTDPNYFRRIASAARGWSGMTFHFDYGIHSEPIVVGTPQDNCRLAFLEGIGA